MKLFERLEECCGCGACANVCPRHAIAMKTGADGFVYPEVDGSKCVRCGACLRVCRFKAPQPGNLPLRGFAAMSRNKELLRRSSSGAVFSTIALEMLKNRAVVYGCEWTPGRNDLTPRHARIDSAGDLPRLQGSKYVQSDMGSTFVSVADDLRAGRTVLFSGTPCQVAALKGFLGDRSAENLFLLDVVCHGIPSVPLFHGYVSFLERKGKAKVEDYLFRDKTWGWCPWASALFKKNGRTRRLRQNARNSAYWHFFLKGDVFRDSCYACPYARAERQGDLTLGDFWGISKVLPDFAAKLGGGDDGEGISCVLVNSPKGMDLLDRHGSALSRHEVPWRGIVENNDQLRAPCPKTKDRDLLREVFARDGYEGVHELFLKKIGLKFYFYRMWDSLPRKFRAVFRRFAKRKILP
ncbi:MAG: Coenzyme F420 hydrogenase/dehydrogenase, beta subunit C-terminal domain [Kiritimatiellae bacterium]|nr:Coenzyme F420 hydrogenase/dehydrogenase, beta subunit C-terminal domain [Kiritimatiellia bacterium]